DVERDALPQVAAVVLFDFPARLGEGEDGLGVAWVVPPGGIAAGALVVLAAEAQGLVVVAGGEGREALVQVAVGDALALPVSDKDRGERSNGQDGDDGDEQDEPTLGFQP